MYNPQSMLLSPISKRREVSLEDDGQDIALETSQLMIRSPAGATSMGNMNKRPRYEPSWTLDNLCTHPYSPLASIDLESLFNTTTLQMLPQDKRQELCSLLPQVDQNTFLDHPNNSNEMSFHDTNLAFNNNNNENYHPAYNQSNNFFSKTENPIFWNSLTGWQTMLAHGQFMDQAESPPLPLSPSPPTTTNNSSSNKSTVSSSYRPHKSTKPRSPSSSKKDKFKDEAFESYWGELIDKERAHNVAGDSKSVTLKDMCRKGLIREDDVIVYKRNFSACKVVVSKSMTVIKACGLSGISIKLDEEVFEDFETPTALETKILDHHGQVTKDKRPNGNAFKSIRLLRAGKDMGRLFDIRKDGFGDQSAW